MFSKSKLLVTEAKKHSDRSITTSPFFRIPSAVIQSCIVSVMDTKTVSAFSRTSPYASTLTKPELTKRKTLKTLKLLNHVVRGEEAEAKKMLDADPRLLLERGLVVDYSGRQIEGTAFQLALGAEDAEMCEMIAPYFNLLTDRDGVDERMKQYQAQFPESKDGAEVKGEIKREETRDTAALKKLIEIIRNSDSDEACEPALQAFRDFLQPREVIKTGKHFNAELLLTAFQLYDQNYEEFGDYSTRKNILCWRKVIGYIQRFLPSCYAQAFCQGLYYLVEGGEKLRRSLEFRYDPGYFFFPLSSSAGLGYEFAARARVRRLPGGRGVALPLFSKLMSSKNSSIAKLNASPDNSKEKRCVIM